MNEVITYDHVSRYFGNTKAVEDICLTINSGSVVSILGPNGAGKTTVINMMLGIIKPSQGRLSLRGKDPGQYRNRQCLGAMLQQAGLPETMKPFELIKMWRSYYHKPLSIDDTVEIAGISEIKNIRYGRLSGGQRRRVAFALAISGNPEILFLDEPSTGMDLSSRTLLWRQIRAFASLHKTVVLCTHYLEEADALSDRIVLMNDGRIIADDTPQNIKAAVSMKTITCKTNIEPNILTNHPLVEKASFLSPLTILETSKPEQLLIELFTLDPLLTDLQVARVSLEQAFLTLIEKQ